MSLHNNRRSNIKGHVQPKTPDIPVGKWDKQMYSFASKKTRMKLIAQLAAGTHGYTEIWKELKRRKNFEMAVE